MSDEFKLEEWKHKNREILQEILVSKSLKVLKNISEMPTGQLDLLVDDLKSIAVKIKEEQSRRKGSNG
jgi:hypothetical protein